MKAKVAICGDGLNIARKNIKALFIEEEIRADERAKVVAEFTKKLYEQENNINDANYGFNFVKKVIDEMNNCKGN